MTDFTLNEKTYRAGKMSAMKQFHVARRMAPVLGKLVELMPAIQKMEEIENENSLAGLEPVLEGFCEAIGGLTDADAEYIIGACLDVCEIKQDGGAWSRLRVNNVSMFELDLPDMLQVSFKVIAANFTSIGKALKATLPAAAPM